MDKIIDINTNKTYSIFSNKGKALLKKYVLAYQNGGSGILDFSVNNPGSNLEDWGNLEDLDSLSDDDNTGLGNLENAGNNPGGPNLEDWDSEDLEDLDWVSENANTWKSPHLSLNPSLEVGNSNSPSVSENSGEGSDSSSVSGSNSSSVSGSDSSSVSEDPEDLGLCRSRDGNKTYNMDKNDCEKSELLKWVSENNKELYKPCCNSYFQNKISNKQNIMANNVHPFVTDLMSPPLAYLGWVNNHVAETNYEKKLYSMGAWSINPDTKQVILETRIIGQEISFRNIERLIKSIKDVLDNLIYIPPTDDQQDKKRISKPRKSTRVRRQVYTKEQIPNNQIPNNQVTHKRKRKRNILPNYEDVKFNSLTIGFEYELTRGCCLNNVDNQWKALKEEHIICKKEKDANGKCRMVHTSLQNTIDTIDTIDTNHKVKFDYEGNTKYEFVSEPYNYDEISKYPKDLKNAIESIYNNTSVINGTLQVSFGIELNEIWKLFHLISALYSKKIIKTNLSDYNWDIIKKDSKNWVNKYIRDDLIVDNFHKVEFNTSLYGMYCLLFHYIDTFRGYSKFDPNTGMKGIPLLMLRNRFCDVYNLLNDGEKQQFIKLRNNISEELNLTLNYLAYNQNLGKYPISVKNWMNTIIDPKELKEYLVPYNKRIDEYIKNFDKQKFKQDIINRLLKFNNTRIISPEITQEAEEQADQKVKDLISVKKSIYVGPNFQEEFDKKRTGEGDVSTYYDKYVNLPDQPQQPQPNMQQGQNLRELSPNDESDPNQNVWMEALREQMEQMDN